MSQKNIKIKTKIPGPKSQELMKRRLESVSKGPFHSTPVFVKRAHGGIIEDVDGNMLIDFASGIGVVNIGHTPKSVVSAIQSQAEQLIHSSFNVLPYEGYILLCEKLNQMSPGTFSKKTFLVNSGAEAVENAVKIARVYTKKQGIVCFDHAFHGRTYMALSLTAKEVPYKQGMGPYCSDVLRTAFPYPYRDLSAEQCIEKFKETVAGKVDKIAAVMIEPVLGEGGFIPAPKDFLIFLEKFCKDNKVLLLVDEIQTGFGRTGTLFASEQLGLTPDILITAKGLGSGMPISAVTGRSEIMDAMHEGGIGGTYGGNPISCAAALAVFETFQNSDVLQNAKKLARILHERLKFWQSKYECVGDVRGLGLMLAMELVKDKSSKEPSKEYAKQLIQHCYENGVVLLTAGTYGNVFRFLMPITISEEVISEGLDVVEAGLKKL